MVASECSYFCDFCEFSPHSSSFEQSLYDFLIELDEDLVAKDLQ